MRRSHSLQSRINRVASILGSRTGSAAPPGPRVFIAGHQLTGKSTVAALLAGRLAVGRHSGGAMVRRMAAEAGVSVEEMSRRLAAAPNADSAIDRALSVSALAAPGVVESRMAGWLGLVFEKATGLPARRVLLECDEVERAARWFQREVGPEAGHAVRHRLGELGGVESLLEALGRAAELLPRDLRPDPRTLADAGRRDEADGERLLDLYGVHYDAPEAFDLVVDVTDLRPEEATDLLLLSPADSPRHLLGAGRPRP
jgi:cytidylate kinase